MLKTKYGSGGSSFSHENKKMCKIFHLKYNLLNNQVKKNYDMIYDQSYKSNAGDAATI